VNEWAVPSPVEGPVCDALLPLKIRCARRTYSAVLAGAHHVSRRRTCGLVPTTECLVASWPTARGRKQFLPGQPCRDGSFSSSNFLKNLKILTMHDALVTMSSQ
jgi:hypothetical protein